MCKDHSGKIWMGIHGKTGLRVYDPLTDELSYVDIKTSDGKRNNFPATIIEDKSGRLWLLEREAEKQVFGGYLQTAKH
ncbi:MAG: hypothetical protein IPO92_13825 [Saprospiraceae bacterium]|nr:hypothetical protein [Saprospiraceae bacterium]